MSAVNHGGPDNGRQAGIRWRAWGTPAFTEARELDRPVLLHLTAGWCHWCRLMDETTWADGDVVAAMNEEFLPVRVDADRHPHVQDRYIAGGWPTNAFLTPDGEVLWAGTFLDAQQFRTVAASVAQAWQDRRAELDKEIGRRRQALESARRRPSNGGLVRREAADDVIAATLDSFDPRNGGFGDAPKFPRPEAIELLYTLAEEDPTTAALADQCLDGMLAGELWDAADGGFFRYATAADWTEPRREKLLDANAGMLDAYALGAWLRERGDWREIAGRTVDWVERRLGLDNGLWAGSQTADEAWFAAAPGERAGMTPPPADGTVYTDATARWIAALARAGARLDEPAWVQRAEAALATAAATLMTADGAPAHFLEPEGEPALDFLAADTLELARAAMAVGSASGNTEWWALARDLVRRLESQFWSDDGGFFDRLPSAHDVGALRYRDRPFELNARAALLLLDMARIDGQRGCRARAEGILARLGAVAGRHGPDGAVFALATASFFQPPPAVIVAVPATGERSRSHAGQAGFEAAAAALRSAALSLRVPQLRVWTVRDGHSAGPQRFTACDGRPAAWLWTVQGCTGPFVEADALAAAMPVRHA